MSILAWGKGKLETTPSVNGAPVAGAQWATIDTPKEDTLKVTPTAGTEKTASEEGGEVVDVRKGKTTFVLEFDLFVKKGVDRPFDDNDGFISGEHCFRFTPEDDGTEGFQIDRSYVACEESYSCAEGKMLHYTARVLKPATGKALKPYVEGSLTVTKNELYFGNAADSTGKTVTATSTGNITASSNADWCTVTTAAKVATIKVAANSGTTPREAIVVITADNKTALVRVLQIPA